MVRYVVSIFPSGISANVAVPEASLINVAIQISFKLNFKQRGRIPLYSGE
jgi:hypothetical protein